MAAWVTAILNSVAQILKGVAKIPWSGSALRNSGFALQVEEVTQVFEGLKDGLVSPALHFALPSSALSWVRNCTA